MRPTFDLQSHSLWSDGDLPPAEVVAAAAAAGVERLALTDHDAVDGVAEALRAGAQHGIAVVPGAEISALDGPHEDLHICAYLVDHTSKTFLATLREFREDRNVRGGRMLEALEECGFALERAAVDARAAEGSPVGRPHLARAVFDHPDNRARLEDEGLTDAGQVLVAYLIPGTPGYRRRTRPTVQEAIDVIHAAGGLAVWAHPFWDVDSDDEVLDTVDRFAAMGIDGVECFYATHTEAQTRLVAGHCEQLGLLSTGSADFHGPEHRLFHAFRAFETYDLTPRLGPIAGP
ncbi:MAG: PHP domain-containing protein [Solirubrobacterales bacterium]|nr:PHP domain-containing protein [Solirubrobacterales bacterium]